MDKKLLIVIIIGFALGFATSSIWFTPEVETSTQTTTDVSESVTESSKDTIYVEKIVPEIVYVPADSLTTEQSEDSIKTTKAHFSNRSIGLLASIEHSGYIYNVEFEYRQKTRFVRETQNLKIIEREVTTFRQVTRTIKPPILKLRASTIFSPSVLGVTGGIQYHSLHIEAGKDFINNEPMVQVGISFSPSKLIKRIF